MNILYSTDQDLLYFEKNKYKEEVNKYEVINGEEFSINDIISLAKQQDIFAENKIKVFFNVILKNNEKIIVAELGNIDVIFLVLLKPRESIQTILEKYAKTLTKQTKSKTLKLIDEILIANNSTFADEDAREYFYKTVGDETFSLENEAIKLANYTPKITKDDVDALVMKFDEQNLFALVELIVAKDITASIKLVDSLVLSKYSVIDIINIIAGQLFTLKLIIMSTDNAFQISKQLNIPIWLLKKQMEILTKDSGKQIDNLLNSLSQMELDIKSNTINPYNNFILLLLSNNA